MSTHIPPQIDVAILLRYLLGESSADEARHVEAWRDRTPANAARLAALRHGAASDPAQIAVDVDRGMVRLHERLDSADGALASAREHQHTNASRERVPTPRWSGIGQPPVRRRVSSWSRWAAAAVVVVGLGVAVYGTSRQTRSVTPGTVAMRTYETAPGQRATISLPDGTHVILSVASRLSYPADFGKTSRDVTVEGEAYFEVVHNANNPFTVYAGNSQTTVLGTSFAVRRYPNDTAVRVVVASGRVSVDAAVVNAGDVALRSAHGLYVAHDTSAARLLSWITGQLTFENVALRDVFPELSRWYGVTFQWDPAIGDELLTSSFTNRSLEEVTRALTEQRGLTFTRTGNTIFIRKGQ